MSVLVKKTPRKTKIKKANKELQPVVMWLIRSGAIATILTGLLTALASLQSGSMDVKSFLVAVGGMTLAALINSALVWIKTYNEQSD